MTEIPKKYDYKTTEKQLIEFWEENGFYHSIVNHKKKKYSVVIPPPNVTGILHIGHILNNTIQDIYCRWKRMKGYEVCWVPGMDHAGISTQIMVERDLIKKGKSKNDYSREEFVNIIWKWKEKHAHIIRNQLKKLGISVDWSRERFTLDNALSKAVKEVFVDLYHKNLIYKGKRIINWDPVSQTALSDDEIEYIEKKDKLYYIKYFLSNSEEFIPIATTRPETMFGDTAVAVNSDDERYKKYIGKHVILPLVNKKIPVIYDNYVDMEFGTGALKITPAHDVNDFEVGKRHNLESVNILTKDGKLNEYGLEFKGMDILTARKKIVQKLKNLDLLIKEEDYIHNVAIASKSGGFIEPYISDQWFVSMKQLSYPAIEAVRNGKIRFHPDRYKKIYFHWMENIKDWCISRQLWWGHQIPIWYNKNTGEIYCNSIPPEDIQNWIQEEDVLDTWFSSWLWSFSSFGWENSENDKHNEDLKYYYPTDFLVTAADIIFLWVARMIMAGLEYLGNIPFKDVYFHSLVRDGKGRKMSKTLGNSPDPLNVMDKYGADALRFTLVYLTPLGNDVLYDEEKTEIGRNFITKLWNAGRFLINNINNYTDGTINKCNDDSDLDLIEKWINSKFNSAVRDVEINLDNYILNDYAKSLYKFVWNDFCDWYIELIKIKISSDKNNAISVLSVATSHYENILKLLHPVIPFVTEHLWHLLNESRTEESISLSDFPESNLSKINAKIEDEFENLKQIVTSIRNLKSENNIPHSQKCKIIINCKDKKSKNFIEELHHIIILLCNLESLEYTIDTEINPERKVSNVLTDYEIYLFLDYGIDINVIRNKYEKEIENLKKYISTIEKKLSNKNFVEKASEQVIEMERNKLNEAEEKLNKLKNIISNL